jgi:superfamily II DNA or RNA helicase
MMTGGGKSEVFCWIAQEMAAKRRYCFVVTRGRELVYNAHERLVRRGIDAGILMAGNEYEAGKYVYVISIDTLNRRQKEMAHKPDLIVIDEAHFAGAASFVKLAETYPEAFYLAVTATPWPKDSIRHVADDWVAPVTYDELVGQGFLVPSKPFAPISHNLGGLKTLGGDYQADDLAAVMDSAHVFGNIVDYYAKVTAKASALCFCVNVRHSLHLRNAFRAVGIAAEHLDADSPDNERKRVLSLLRTGAINVVTNCNILSTGVDIPELGAVIMARPTKSRMLFVQQAGRGSRPYAGKEFFWLMDHANNLAEHGFVEEFSPPEIDGKPKGRGSGAQPVKTCPTCFAVVPAAVATCPACAHVFDTKREIKEATDYELKEMKRGDRDVALDCKKDSRILLEIDRLKMLAQMNGYKPGWVFFKVKTQYGEATAKKHSARIFGRGGPA